MKNSIHRPLKEDRNQYLTIPNEQNKEEKVKIITNVFRHKANKKQWRQVNRSTRKLRGSAILFEKIPTNDGVKEVDIDGENFNM